MRYFLCSFVVLTFLATGCDQLSATMQSVSVLTKTPNLANAEGMDTALTAALDLSLSALDMPAATLVAVGVAEKESATSTAAPTPVPGAKVFLSWLDQEAKVCEKTDTAGSYAATSVPLDPCSNGALTYIENETYTTRIETGSDYFTIESTPPAPVNAAAVAFTPQMSVSSSIYGYNSVIPSHARGVDLKVDWSADPAAKERHAFAVVLRIRFTGTAGQVLDTDPSKWEADDNNPVFDNTPKKPEEMIDLIINDPVTSVTIPGQQALNVTGLYVLILTTTEVSTTVSSNLALGSGGLAGAGVAFVFWVD